MVLKYQQIAKQVSKILITFSLEYLPFRRYISRYINTFLHYLFASVIHRRIASQASITLFFYQQSIFHDIIDKK